VRLYSRVVVALSAVALCLGVAILAVTAAHGGGQVGYVTGGLFVLLGVARIALERKRRG
jgi:hypothetical protein